MNPSALAISHPRPSPAIVCYWSWQVRGCLALLVAVGFKPEGEMLLMDGENVDLQR